jgi:hypothetical protein
VAGDEDVAVALVVAEDDVVARLQRLDEVVLEQQRLGLGARDRGFGPGDLRHHHRRARAVVLLLEIRGDALLEVACLADVDRFALRAEEAIDAGKVGQPGDEFGGVELRAHAERMRARFSAAAR